jgi:hypothetical protein
MMVCDLDGKVKKMEDSNGQIYAEASFVYHTRLLYPLVPAVYDL